MARTTGTIKETIETGGSTGHANRVLLRGRVTSAPQERQLPSGDLVVGVRVTVSRDPGGTARVTRSSPATRSTVDWFECGAWTSALRRSVSRWQVGDVVEVEGALRRRFPRGGGTSRVEVEVLRAHRLARG